MLVAWCGSLSHQALAQGDGMPGPQGPIRPNDGSRLGVVLAPGLGFGIGLGHFHATPNDRSTSPLSSWYDRSVHQSVSGQLPFSLSVAYRAIPLVSFGFTTSLAKVFPAHCSEDCAGGAFYLGSELRLHFLTDRSPSPWFSFGLGYELLHFETNQGSATFHGYGIDLQAGGDFWAGQKWTVGPYMGLRIGAYAHIVSAPSWRGVAQTSTEISFGNQAIHAWVTSGVRGTFTFSRK